MSDREVPPQTRELLDRVMGPGWSVEQLRGDASSRIYWRVRRRDGTTAIASFYPEPIREGLDRALRAWQSLGVCTPLPRLLGWDGSGLVQEDVGDCTLISVLRQDRDRGLELYGVAVDLLAEMQNAPPDGRRINPPFDRERFMIELDMTGEWYVERLAGATYGEELRQTFVRLADLLTSHPYLLTHRDYHGENVHVIDDRLVVIDFQDLREGPDTYDLASLLRDRGVARLLGRDAELELVNRWAERIGHDSVLQRYHETLLQRTLKTIGTFARQAVERGRDHYLEYIPPALETVEICLSELDGWDRLEAEFPREWSGRR